MAGPPGDFLRATFYRWSERFPDVCMETISAPAVRAVGDVHVGNFGTWPSGGDVIRWGLNDFDEAGWMPFTNDLARLATSALLARSDLDPELVGRTILSGYSQRIRVGGFGALDVADETELRDGLGAAQPSAEAFFGKLAGKDRLDADDARRLARLCERLNEAVPGGELHHRRAGRGSLGRVRVLSSVTVTRRSPSRPNGFCAQPGRGHAEAATPIPRRPTTGMTTCPRCYWTAAGGRIRRPASRRSMTINVCCARCRRTGWASRTEAKSGEHTLTW